MHRRTFLTIASGVIFVPKYEKWFKVFRGPERIITATETLTRINESSALFRAGLRKDFLEVYDSYSYEYQKFTKRSPGGVWVPDSV